MCSASSASNSSSTPSAEEPRSRHSLAGLASDESSVRTGEKSVWMPSKQALPAASDRLVLGFDLAATFLFGLEGAAARWTGSSICLGFWSRGS